MPCTDIGAERDEPMSAHWSATNAANVSSGCSARFTNVGAATWPPSAASSSAASIMDPSATAPVTQIHLASSPPTSHVASPARTRSSPLRPSSAVNFLEGSPTTCELAKSAITAPSEVQRSIASGTNTDAYVASSDPEDGTHGGNTDGADTPPRNRSPSPRSRSRDTVALPFPDMHVSTVERSVYVQIPASSPPTRRPRESSSTKKAPRRPEPSGSSDSAKASSSTVLEDAAFAAALAAQEETLARRRPTRNARKEVSYSPSCDRDGRPLAPKKVTTASVPSFDSKTATIDAAGKTAKAKRRSKAFSDEGNEREDGGIRPANNSSTNASASRVNGDNDDAELTDDDAGFKSRGRKKPRVSEKISLDSASEDEWQGSRPRTSSRKTRAKREHPSREEIAIDDAVRASGEGEGEDDGILTPPAPLSPRRSSRKGVPTTKKQQLQALADEHATTKKGKAKQQKTFEVCGDDEKEVVAVEEHREHEKQPRRSHRQEALAPETLATAGNSCSTADDSDDEQAQKQASPAQPSSSTSSIRVQPQTEVNTASASTIPALASTAPVSVAIKRISAASSSPSPSSPSSPHSPGPRSFFGKPLTTLLTASAVRRPGLTRKTKIPSLLNHRGVPKPPAPQLAASKRRMQDDDYEYDADYEALIAKNKKGSDEESDGEDARKDDQADGRDDHDEVELEDGPVEEDD